MDNVQSNVALGQKKKNCYVALSRPTVKCEKTGSGFFGFFLVCLLKMSDLGEEFAQICIQWLKKALVYMRFDCIPAEFSPFRNCSKKYWKTQLSDGTKKKMKKKKKKKKSTDRPNFQILVGWGQHNTFFCGLIAMDEQCHTVCYHKLSFTFSDLIFSRPPTMFCKCVILLKLHDVNMNACNLEAIL